mgnify:CR=1 FL=1
MSSLAAVKVWIWLSVFATGAGWLLSFFGILNWIGYIVLGVVTLITCSELRNRGLIERGNLRFGWNWQKLRRRFCRPFPLMFLALALLALFGGLLYPPSNHTGLSYRIPRVLNWLAADQWHWIYAPNIRVNTRTPGMEWLTAPLFLVLRSDRFLFLLNIIPFLLTPGLLFSMLTRLGVRARVAWQWMWILPTAYVFLLQAGSAGNDAFPVVYALAAIDFGCRAWTSRKPSDLWHSGLAIALLTGAKASNLPLCLMWLVLVAPLWRLLREKPIGATVVGLIMILVSAVPTMLLNWGYVGNWSGLNIEKPGMALSNPFVGLWGNPLLLALNNLCPPFFPIANWWNQNAVELLPEFLRQPLINNFEWPFHQLWEIPFEDWAGLGPSVSLLMMIAGGWAIIELLRRKTLQPRGLAMSPRIWKLTLLSGWIGLAAYCMKSGMVTPGRLIAPYYPLLLPGLLLGGGQLALIKTRWWRVLVWLNFLVAVVVLVITPPRPLWPARTILTKLQSQYPDNRIIERALATYTAYSIRHDPLAPLRDALPPKLELLGLVSGPDELDISFYRPFFARRIAYIGVHNEDLEKIRARKIEYAIASELLFELEKVSLEDWLKERQAEVLTNYSATITVSTGPQKYHLIRFPTNQPPKRFTPQ